MSMQTDPDSDDALIRRCQSATGDAAQEAFEELFRRHRDRTYNLAFYFLGNAADAEDVAQVAFLTVFRKIGDFRFSSRFSTWLYRVVYNLCVDLRRRTRDGSTGHGHEGDRESREDRHGSSSGLAGEQLADRAPGPADLVADEEFRRRAVERALERLSEPLRAVVLLRYMEELPYHEVAEVLGLSVGTVKSRLSRAHAFLKEILEPP